MNLNTSDSKFLNDIPHNNIFVSVSVFVQANTFLVHDSNISLNISLKLFHEFSEISKSDCIKSSDNSRDTSEVFFHHKIPSTE